MKTADVSPLIFLDIDGVLNSLGWKMSRDYFHIPDYDNSAAKDSDEYLLGELDLTPIAILDELLIETNAKLVISSSWRHLRQGVDWFKLLFTKRGAKQIPRAITDRTPKLSSESEFHRRGKEVDAFLSTQSESPPYICIDDTRFHYQPYHPVVETNPGIGLSVVEYQMALDLLLSYETNNQYADNPNT